MSGIFDDFEKIADVPEVDETQELSEETMEVEEGLKGELRTDVPGVDRAIVYGNPEETGAKLDSEQGDAYDYALGTCGLTSAANIGRMAGLDTTETMAIDYAMENGLCEFAPGNPYETGATSDNDIEKVIEGISGIPTHVEISDYCKVEELADAVISGRGVVVALNSGVIWDRPESLKTEFGKLDVTHAVTLTGVALDAYTGDPAGFYICDSGNFEACQYVPVDVFRKAYEGCEIAAAYITDDPIR